LVDFQELTDITKRYLDQKDTKYTFIKLPNEGYPYFVIGVCCRNLVCYHNPLEFHEWWMRKFKGEDLNKV